MKRALVLVFGLVCLVGGLLIDSPTVQAKNSGDHFVKGKIVALEGCYSKETSVESICLGVVETALGHRSGKIVGDVYIGKNVYQECVSNSVETKCSKVWRASVGESYLVGGELTEM
ncbi:hypothetical protein N1M2_158 [Klebsiella phage N1M2]|uniref:Uncharacterized protein n=1 Tax=Klebsiella phage N1M2 TaxID=2664939 RepID=A0A6B7ZFW7_9CAUD|nr:membrane protein [Klebsiella phage N1M2]QGH72021.1 hypothetical protein N1M2_158 [Klebsiella phage N1M2]